MKTIKRILAFVQILLMISFVFVFSVSFNSKMVYAEDPQVGCCEKDNSNPSNYCTYTTKSECKGQWATTSCDQTSFCKPGCCAGINGFCYNNYAKATCEGQYGGSFNSDSSCNAVSECKLGCCLIGTQAAYLTRTRCINETGKYPDLEVDFREEVNSEQECLNLARNTEKGCCVTSDRVCRYGAKSQCTGQEVLNGTGFYANTTCSSLQSYCDCAPPDKSNPRATMCLPNDDRVFWKDSCGNPEGVVTGINLKTYDKLAALSDGNCDFNKGTQCGDSNSDGIYVCESLDCQGGTTNVPSNKKLSISADLANSEGRVTPDVNKDGVLNGESWCSFDSPDQEQINEKSLSSTAGRLGMDPPGSRYYRHLCINGQELVEPCKDFREEYCYYNPISVGTTTPKIYTESRCIKNDWQPCVDECNTANPVTMNAFDYNESLRKDYACCMSPKRDCYWNGNRCTPAVAPGFKFWEGEGANICSKANTKCSAIFRCGGWNSLFGACGADTGSSGVVGGLVGSLGSMGLAAVLATGPVGWGLASAAIVGGLLIGTSTSKGGWTIISGGECLSQDYLQAANNLCRASGDCGADFNYMASYTGDSGNLDEQFTLGTSGFTNTQNIKEELGDYAKDNIDKLQSTKSNSNRASNYTFDFVKSGGVPGNLTGDPNWDMGKDFYNYNVPKNELGNTFKRLFTQSEIAGVDNNDAAGFFSGPVGLSLISSIGFGIIGAGLLGGGGFATGFSSSPIGFLLSKGLGYLSKSTGEFFKAGEGLSEKILENAAKSVEKKALDASAQAYKSTIDKAVEGAAKKASDDAYNSFVKNAVDKALENSAKTSSPLNPEYVVKEATKAAEEGAKEAANKAWETTRDEIAKGAESKAKDAGTEAYKSTVKEAKDAAAEGLGKRASTFSQVMNGVNAAMWVYTVYQIGDVLLEDTQTVEVSTTCLPWQPPVYRATAVPDQKDLCQLCNSNYYLNADKTPKDIRAFAKCSEYRCKSLGPTCELINKGTTEETCVSISKLDTASPKIQPWYEAFTLNITAKDITVNQGGNGFIINKPITIYTPFSIGIKTDEPSQCKMSFDHSKRYESMDSNFFGGNIFNYFHANSMMYPASKNTTIVNGSATGISLTGGGHYKLYMRCIDASGNAGEADYTIEFNVKNEPDLTAPTIVGSSIAPPLPTGMENQTTQDKEVYLMNGANYTDITLFLNEPAECRYSEVPLDFDYMNTSNSCTTGVGTPDQPPYYGCQFIRGVIVKKGIGPALGGFTSVPGMTKYFYFKCRDHPEPGYKETRNYNKDSYVIILRGSDAVKIDKLSPSGLIKTSNALVNVTLEVQTSGGALLNGKATCKYTTEEINKENLAAMTEFLNTGSSLHTQPWQPGSGLQKFYIGCYDKAGNRAYGLINFTVEKDVSAPKITKVYTDTLVQPPQFTLELNEPGECKDSIEGTFDYNIEGNLMNAIGTNGMIFASTSVGSNIYYVVCRDKFNNTMAPAVVQLAQV